MATERFLHMRLTREDCELLDALVERVNQSNGIQGKRRPHVGKPRDRHSRSDVVRLAIAEALLKRCEERV